MTTKPKRDERGQFMPKWAAGMRYEVLQTKENVRQLVIAIHGREVKDGETATIPMSAPLQSQINDLRDRLGTSTPLIIWNIAVLIAIAGLGVAVAKLYGVVP